MFCSSKGWINLFAVRQWHLLPQKGWRAPVEGLQSWLPLAYTQWCCGFLPSNPAKVQLNDNLLIIIAVTGVPSPRVCPLLVLFLLYMDRVWPVLPKNVEATTQVVEWCSRPVMTTNKCMVAFFTNDKEDVRCHLTLRLGQGFFGLLKNAVHLTAWCLNRLNSFQ